MDHESTSQSSNNQGAVSADGEIINFDEQGGKNGGSMVGGKDGQNGTVSGAKSKEMEDTAALDPAVQSLDISVSNSEIDANTSETADTGSGHKKDPISGENDDDAVSEKPLDQSSLRQALVGFYGVHNPSRISAIDDILRQYSGREGLLIARLEEKYSASISFVGDQVATRPPASPLPPEPQRQEHPPATSHIPRPPLPPSMPGGSSSAVRPNTLAP
ncbi:unnamed protein product, partial [Discosporangium mesarthrocarpum]